MEAFGIVSEGASPLALPALRDVRGYLARQLPDRSEALRASIPRWHERGPSGLGRVDGLAPRGKLAGHPTRKRLMEELEQLESRVIEVQQERAAVRALESLGNEGGGETKAPPR